MNTYLNQDWKYETTQYRKMRHHVSRQLVSHHDKICVDLKLSHHDPEYFTSVKIITAEKENVHKSLCNIKLCHVVTFPDAAMRTVMYIPAYSYTILLLPIIAVTYHCSYPWYWRPSTLKESHTKKATA